MATTQAKPKELTLDRAAYDEIDELRDEIAEQAAARRESREDRRAALGKQLAEIREQTAASGKAHRPTYTSDQLASFARAADQQIRLGITFVEAAKRQGIAVPTLRKAFEESELQVPPRGRRPKVPRSRLVKPKVEADRANETMGEPDQPKRIAGNWVPLFFPLEQVVLANRTLVLDYLLEGKDKKIQDAVHNLLDN